MVEAATWQMSSEHLDESVRMLLDNMDEEGAAIVIKVDGEWLPLIEVGPEGAVAREWEEAVDGIGLEGKCSTMLGDLDGVKPGPVRVAHDDDVDGLLLSIGSRPILAVAGPKMKSLPKGLLHLEAAELSEEELKKLANIPVGRELVSLDVGGSEELSSSRGARFLERFPNLQALDLSELNSLSQLEHVAKLDKLRELNLAGSPALEDLSPLAKCKALKHVDLSDCNRVTDLMPVSKLTHLTSLELSGCKGLQDFNPLAELPALSFLALSECTQLPDLAPLGRIISLKSIDLSLCPNIESVGALRACGNLERVVLTGSTAVRDAQALAGCTSLREIELDDEELSAVVLAGSAVQRADADFVENNLHSWMELLAECKSPARFVLAMLPAVRLGSQATWAAEAAEELIDFARDSVLPDHVVWKELFTAILTLGDSAGRSGVEKVLTELIPGKDTLPIIRAALDVLAVVKPNESKWAHALVDKFLDSLLTTPLAVDVAPDAVRYCARTGQIDGLEPWIEVLRRTAETPPKTAEASKAQQAMTSLEDDPAALGGLVGRLAQKQPDSPPVAQLVAALAGLAKQRPDSHLVEPFVDHFVELIRNRSESITVARIREALEQLLIGQPEGDAAQRVLSGVVRTFQNNPANPAFDRFVKQVLPLALLRLPVFIREHPDDPTVARLGEEIAVLLKEDPRHPTVVKLAEIVECARDAGVVVFARSVLDHPSLRAKTTKEDIDSFVAAFDVRGARRAAARGLVDTLCAEDILGNKARNGLLTEIERDLVNA